MKIKTSSKARKVATALVSKANKTKPVRNHIITKETAGNWHWENNIQLSNEQFRPVKCVFSKAEISSWRKKWGKLKGYANYRKFKTEVGGLVASRANLDSKAVKRGMIHSAQYDYCCTRAAEMANLPQFTHKNKGWDFKDGRCHSSKEAQKKCA